MDSHLAVAGAAVILCLVQTRWGRAGGARGRPQLHAAVALLIAALVGGGFIIERFERIEFDWPEVAAERQARLSSVLSRRMTTVVERGRSAAGRRCRGQICRWTFRWRATAAPRAWWRPRPRGSSGWSVWLRKVS